MMHINDASSRGVVVGHDHRHNSERWARLTAAAFLTNGVKVYLHRGLVHTPMYCRDSLSVVQTLKLLSFRVPFSLKRLNAACGIMITGMLSINMRNVAFLDIS